MRELKGFLFDVGGVLLTIDYALLAEEAARRHGRAAPTAEHFERAEWRGRVLLDDLVRRQTTECRDTFKTLFRHIWAEAWTAAGAEVPGPGAFEEWARALEEIHHRVNLWQRRAPGAPEALARLADAGLVLGVVSNADGRVARLLEEAGLARYLKVILDSSVEGVEKPDPEIFRRALARLGVAPDQAVFLGDLYSVDVVGARRAGLGALLMDPGACWTVRDVPTVASLADAAERVWDLVQGSSPSPWAPQGATDRRASPRCRRSRAASAAGPGVAATPRSASSRTARASARRPRRS